MLTSIRTIPFSFSGELTGNAVGLGIVNPILTATISGQGLATFAFYDFSLDPSPHYVLSTIEYRFVPELEAIILLSSGLSVLIAGTQLRRAGDAGRAAVESRVFVDNHRDIPYFRLPETQRPGEDNVAQ